MIQFFDVWLTSHVLLINLQPNPLLRTSLMTSRSETASVNVMVDLTDGKNPGRALEFSSSASVNYTTPVSAIHDISSTITTDMTRKHNNPERLKRR